MWRRLPRLPRFRLLFLPATLAPPPHWFSKILAFLPGTPAPVKKKNFFFFSLHRFTRTLLAFSIGSPAPNWHFPSAYLTGFFFLSLSIGSPGPNWLFASVLRYHSCFHLLSNVLATSSRRISNALVLMFPLIVTDVGGSCKSSVPVL